MVTPDRTVLYVQIVVSMSVQSLDVRVSARQHWVMRIGLAGVGRIGAFHAATLRDLDAVDSLLLVDAVPGRAADVAARLAGAGAGAGAGDRAARVEHVDSPDA